MSLSKSCLPNLPRLIEPPEDSFHVTSSHCLVSVFSPFAPCSLPLPTFLCHFSSLPHHRTRRRRPLQRQRSPVRDDHRWAVRRAQTPHPPLLRLQQRSRDMRLASVYWLLKRPPRFARTPPQRARTASKSMSPRPRLVSERDSEREGNRGRIKGQISITEIPGKRRGKLLQCR